MQQSRYKVKVIATDPSGTTDSIAVTIKPGGSGDAPIITGPRRVEYPESGTWRVSSYSADNGDEVQTWGWNIAVQHGGGDGDFFEIDEEGIDEDGVLTFRDAPDYNNPQDDDGNNGYNFSVTAYDTNPGNGSPPKLGIM